jgi:hypothetical protein
MKLTRTVAIVASLVVLGLSGGLLLAQGKGDYKNPEVPMNQDGTGPQFCVGKTKGRPVFPVGLLKDEPVCSPVRKTFSHKFHDLKDPKYSAQLAEIKKNAEAKKSATEIAFAKQLESCGGCHTGVADAKNLRAGEQIGDVRRPGHKTCLVCHNGAGKDEKMPSFYETDPKKRTICENCHQDALDGAGKPIPGSYNDMTKPLKVISYGASFQDAAGKANEAMNPPCNVEFGFDFSHKTHATQSCKECHEPIRDCKEYKKGPDGKVLIDAYGNPAECAIKADGTPATTSCDRQVLSSPSHPQCWSCHNSKDSKDPQAAEKVKENDCASCHTGAARAAGTGSGSALDTYFSNGYHKNRDFWAELFTHSNHMDYIEKAAPGAPKDAQCRLCHQSQVEADSLVDVGQALYKDIDQRDTCFCCHDGKPAFSPTSATMQFKCFQCHRTSSFTIPAGSHVCKDGKKFDSNVKGLFGKVVF